MKQDERPVPDPRTSAMLDERMNECIAARQEELQEEAAEAALNGNPARSWYLEYIAQEFPAMVRRALS